MHSTAANYVDLFDLRNGPSAIVEQLQVENYIMLLPKFFVPLHAMPLEDTRTQQLISRDKRDLVENWERTGIDKLGNVPIARIIAKVKGKNSFGAYQVPTSGSLEPLFSLCTETHPRSHKNSPLKSYIGCTALQGNANQG